MSHIFDALQRSEAERSGVDLPELSLATELLQSAERAKRAEEVGEAPVAFAPVELESEPLNQAQEFASVPVSIHNESKLVSLVDKDGLAAEKFRYLAVRLRQLQQNRALKKVLITSTIPAEGKSMVAANLACTLARRRQQKTLLLDGDLRRPTIAGHFGLGKATGLSEWLQRGSGPVTGIYQLEGAGLWILPAGNALQNPLELMQTGALSTLMKQLSSWFDWIVIDSPPVLPLGDTSIWARLADGILLVTRQGITQKKQLQRGLEAIDQSKLLGGIINSSAVVSRSNYYYHYGTKVDSPDKNGAEDPRVLVNE
jgi:capsular exopolysaccharide synthesis family protein